MSSGWLTNGLPPVGPIVANGATVSVNDMVNNGTVVNGGLAPVYTQLSASARLPADTQEPGGEVPQSVGATAFQIAAHAAGLIANVGTSTAGAVTMNVKSGSVIIESLTTAPGATYSFTLTDSQITAASPIPQVELIDATNTGGKVQLTSVTNAAGASAFVFTNTGSTAFNGTFRLAFHV